MDVSYKKSVSKQYYSSHDVIILLSHHHSLLKVHVSVVVCVYGLAEVDGIAKLLLQHWFAGVARDLEQKETGVGLGQVVVRGVVLVKHLQWQKKNIGMKQRSNREVIDNGNDMAVYARLD